MLWYRPTPQIFNMAYGSGHNGCPFHAGHASNRYRNLYTMQGQSSEWLYLLAVLVGSARELDAWMAHGCWSYIQAICSRGIQAACLLRHMAFPIADVPKLMEFTDSTQNMDQAQRVAAYFRHILVGCDTSLPNSTLVHHTDALPSDLGCLPSNLVSVQPFRIPNCGTIPPCSSPAQVSAPISGTYITITEHSPNRAAGPFPRMDLAVLPECGCHLHKSDHLYRPQKIVSKQHVSVLPATAVK